MSGDTVECRGSHVPSGSKLGLVGDWGSGQNDRALWHCIVQVYFSISSQVTKPGMNLSNSSLVPRAPVLSLSSDIPEGTFHSYFSYFFSATL